MIAVLLGCADPPDLPALPPALRFVAVDVGVPHTTGGFVRPDGTPSRYLPETMGPGVVLFDPDEDGDLDLFVPDGVPFDDRPREARAHLYRNDPDGSWPDVAAELGLDVQGHGMGGAAADYDGDGDDDLLVTAWGGLRLLRNDGGRFAEVAVGLEPAGDPPPWPMAPVWADLDGDADLDLFVGEYVAWSPAIDVFSSLDGRTKSFTTPVQYTGRPCRLYLQADGRFTDATERAGLSALQGKALGAAVWDLDDDGRLDVVVANDTRPTFLLHNLGDARFEELGLRSGLAYDEDGLTRAGMGIDLAEYGNDGRVGVAIGNFAREPLGLYRATAAPLVFEETTFRAGIAGPTYLPLTFGVRFLDLDLDGLEDLVLANGHIEPEVGRLPLGLTWAQRPMLLRNRGDGTFADASGEAGPGFAEPVVGRALAAGDLDGDGDVDLVLGVNAGRVRILWNESPARPAVRVALRDDPPNTAAVGARVELEAGGVVQRRTMGAGGSYLAGSERTLTFGVPGGGPSMVRVRWPDGAVTEHPDLAPGLHLLER